MCQSTLQLGFHFSYYSTVKAIPLFYFPGFVYVSFFTFILSGLQKCKIKLKGHIPEVDCIFSAWVIYYGDCRLQSWKVNYNLRFHKCSINRYCVKLKVQQFLVYKHVIHTDVWLNMAFAWFVNLMILIVYFGLHISSHVLCCYHYLSLKFFMFNTHTI